MLDITEAALEDKSLDDPAVKQEDNMQKDQDTNSKGTMMSMEEMANLRMGILDQLKYVPSL